MYPKRVENEEPNITKDQHMLSTYNHFQINLFSAKHDYSRFFNSFYYPINTVIGNGIGV